MPRQKFRCPSRIHAPSTESPPLSIVGFPAPREISQGAQEIRLERTLEPWLDDWQFIPFTPDTSHLVLRRMIRHTMSISYRWMLSAANYSDVSRLRFLAAIRVATTPSWLLMSLPTSA